MKILFFVGEFNEGGAERVISILANSLIEKSFDIEILKYHNTENFYKLNPKIKVNSVEENTNNRNNVLKNIIWLRKYFENNTDIVISFLAPFNIIALLANLGNKTPIIVSDRNDPRFVPQSKFRRILRDFLYKKANAVVVQTKHNKEYFDKSIQDKTFVIPNPIELNNYIGLALKTKKKDLIVSVGRLEPQKNQEMLIEAFNEIHKKYSNYKLVIYGEGSYRKQLQELIDKLNLQEFILLPGNEKDILNKMAEAKIYICSSNYEGMSNSLIEAMCIGLPVISTKVSGTEELIGECNGLLIDVNDKDSLINNICLLIENSEVCNKISSNAILVSKKLDKETVVELWENTINKILI